jgi:hypothetical protein
MENKKDKKHGKVGIVPNSNIAKIDLNTGEILEDGVASALIQSENITIITTRKSMPWNSFFLINKPEISKLWLEQKTTIVIFLFLAAEMNYNGFIKITYNRINDMLAISPQTTKKAIERLAEMNYIKYFKDRLGESYTYHINPEIAYRGAGKNYPTHLEDYKELKSTHIPT